MFLSASLFASEYGVNLLQHGGAEGVSLEESGWTAIKGTWTVKSTDPDAYEGNQYFSVQENELQYSGLNAYYVSELEQIIDINTYVDTINQKGQCFQFSLAMSGKATLQHSRDWGAAAAVGYLDINGDHIGFGDAIGKDSSTAEWKHYSKLIIPPVGTQKIRISLVSSKVNNEIAEHYDDIQFVALSPSDCKPLYLFNLVKNGGAENWIRDWGIKAGDWETRTSDPSAREGGAYFYAKHSSGTAILYQNIDLADYQEAINKGVQSFKVSSYMSGSNGWDKGHQTYTFFDSNGKSLAYFSSPIIQSSKSWKSFSKTIKAPKGSTRLKVELHSFRRYGIQNDAYHDDIRVMPLDPEKFQSRELIFNGGAEMNPTSHGWKSNSSRWTVDTKDPAPKEGKAFFYCLDSYGQLYQDIDVSEFADTIDLGVQEFRYEGWHAGSNSTDMSEINIRFISGYDSNGHRSTLSNWHSGKIKTSQNWVKRGFTRVAPKGTRLIRIYLMAWKNKVWYINEKNDGHMDALSLINLPVDADGDGIPTVREREWGLNPSDPADALLDPDDDGFSNYQEFALGTNPFNPEDKPSLNVNTFYSDHAAVYVGQNEEINLHWEITGAESINIYDGDTVLHEDNFQGLRVRTGTLTVYPEQATTYRLIASGLNSSWESALHIGYEDSQSHEQWPDSSHDNQDFILDSLTVMPDGSHYVSRRDGRYSLYAPNGEGNKVLQWNLDGVGLVDHKATVIDDVAIVGSSSASQSKGQVVAFQPDGTVAWQFLAEHPVKAKPISDSSGKVIYAVDYFGKVYALDVLSGALLWAYQLPESDLIVTNTPALQEKVTESGQLDTEASVLVIRTTNNKLFAISIGDQTNKLIWKKSL